jgi:hypothetical protein
VEPSGASAEAQRCKQAPRSRGSTWSSTNGPRSVSKAGLEVEPPQRAAAIDASVRSMPTASRLQALSSTFYAPSSGGARGLAAHPDAQLQPATGAPVTSGESSTSHSPHALPSLNCDTHNTHSNTAGATRTPTSQSNDDSSQSSLQHGLHVYRPTSGEGLDTGAVALPMPPKSPKQRQQQQ